MASSRVRSNSRLRGTTIFRQPAASSLRTTSEPRKPAPPVTTIDLSSKKRLMTAECNTPRVQEVEGSGRAMSDHNRNLRFRVLLLLHRSGIVCPQPESSVRLKLGCCLEDPLSGGVAGAATVVVQPDGVGLRIESATHPELTALAPPKGIWLPLSFSPHAAHPSRCWVIFRNCEPSSRRGIHAIE